MISKSILSLLLVCVALGSGRVHSQEDVNRGPYGFIRLMNAMSAGTGQLDFVIDGKLVRPEGYRLGDMTGGVALRPKSYNVEFRREGVKKGETKVNVVNNETVTLIPFAELVPATDEQPARWEMRILRLKQYDAESRRTATFVSVSREPEIKVEIRQDDEKWEPLFVKRLGVVRADIKQARGYLPVRYKERNLKSLSIAPSGNFVSVLYDDEKGMVQTKNFIDYKYLSPD